MKIAHICPFFKPAICGVGQAVYELAIRQIKAGHEVHIYTSDYDKFKRIKVKEEIIEGITVHRCAYLGKAVNFVTFWPSIIPKLLKEKYDIIHTHMFGHPHMIFASFISKLKGCKLVHTPHCPWGVEGRSLITRALLWVDYNLPGRLSLKLSDKIIAITPWEINFIKKYGGSKEKIIVIPNGMDDLLFKKFKGNYLKEKLKIKGEIVLFLARYNITKGPDKLILAAKEILKERKYISFVFIGPDEGMKTKMIEMSKGERNIFILEPIRNKIDLVKIYQSADIYVLPSLREGLPLTLFEAMAAGLPIVASPVNGIPYEMKEPDNGFFVNYGDIKGLKDKILKLLDNKQLIGKISKNNITKAKNYNWDIITKKTMEVYKSIK